MSDELLTEVEKAASVYNRLHQESIAVIATSESSRNESSAVPSPPGSEFPASEADQSEVSATSNAPLVSVRSLRNELVRFRLLGPRSHAVLMNTLKPEFGSTPQEPPSKSTDPIPETTSESTTANRSDIPDTPKWWQGHSHVEAHSRLLASSYGALKAAASPAQFPRGAVIGMTVRDPRLTTPSKKTDMVSAHYPAKKREMMLGSTKNDSNSESSEVSGSEEEGSDRDTDSDLISDEDFLSDNDDWSGIEEETEEMPTEVEMGPLTIPTVTQHQPLATLPPGMAYSLIWDAETRKIASKLKVPDHLLNRVRSKQFVKSPKLKLDHKATRIPVLLIQQNFQLHSIPNIHTEVSSSAKRRIYSLANDDCSLGSGWDLVVPSNWAMAFWVSLSYRGARACGMQELRKCSLETLTPHFPEDYIDTESGRRYSKLNRQLLEEKFRRYPPDKRRNYGKLLIPNPFHAPWEELIETWNESGKLDHFLGESGGETASLPPPAKRAKLVGEVIPNKESEHRVPSPASQQCQEIEGLDIDLLPKESATVALNPGDLQSSSPAGFYVLRCRDTLAKLIHFLHILFDQGRPKVTRSPPPMECAIAIRQQIEEHGIDECLLKHRSALIPVRLEILHRGDLSDGAMICIPTVADLKALSESKSFQPSEVVHPKGMTVVDGESIVVGTSLLPKKEIKEIGKQRRGRARGKRVKADGDQG